MIHMMAKATIRELRTAFPQLKRIIAREGELIITDRGRPAYILRSYSAPPARRVKRIDYFRRLTETQPHPLSRASAKALDKANRGDR
jgi:antitoxin (DNA-binding transcriptional repressor) of toxin-antitoxin stability system